MKFFDIHEETNTSPYLASIKFTMKDISDKEGIHTNILLHEAMEATIIEQCSQYRKTYYPKSTTYFSTQYSLFISSTNKQYHDDIVEFLNSFSNMAEQIYNDEIKGKYIGPFDENKQNLKEKLDKYLSYAILNTSLNSSLSINEEPAKRRNKI